jgi:hypothetical protein
VPDGLSRVAAASLLIGFLLTACASPQDTIQQQQDKLASLAASTRLIADDWLAGHLSKTYAGTAFAAMLAQVEQQRAVLARAPATLADARGAALSQQAEQLSRLIALMRHDVQEGDTWTLRGRLSSIPLLPETK